MKDKNTDKSQNIMVKEAGHVGVSDAYFYPCDILEKIALI